MAVFTISATTGFSMEAMQLFDLFERADDTGLATQYKTFDDADNYTRFVGTGLTYSGMHPNTALTGGTITSILDVQAGAAVFKVSSMSIAAVDLFNFYLAADTQGALAAMLSGNDTITGGAGNDTLFGFGGGDKLIGGLGADYMAGGGDNDTYVVDNALDQVIELAGEGNEDTVESSVDYALGVHVDHLILTGTAINGTGNILSNDITGNASNNVLDGQTGEDYILGGAGNDTLLGGHGGDEMYGGSGNDTLDGGSESDYLSGETGNDTLLGGDGDDALFGGANNDVLNGGTGQDDMDGGDGNDVYFVDQFTDTVADISGIDRVESSLANYSLGATIENLTLLSGAFNGSGNALNNVIKGNGWDNELQGGGGNDTVNGGLGADFLAGDDGVDTLFGDEGDDLLSGGDANDTLWGGTGQDRLLGGLGVDIVRGGLGDDIYHADIFDVIVEGANQGIDTVIADFTHTLAAHVENLELQAGFGAFDGIGNSFDNRVTGNEFANVIDGKAGADILRGGLGADSYVVDNLGDRVFEVAAPGEIDQVTSSVDFRLTVHVENLTLTGTAMTATGNALANVLNGNASANVIDGRQGADTMTGFNGNDIYYVDDFGDSVTESAGTGTGIDTVFASVTYTLGDNVENLTITGTGTTAGNGNALNNTIIGNANANSIEGKDGDDILEGGLGQDTLFGGGGLDDFRYTHLAADQDTIYDFIAGTDDIVVSAAAFGGGLVAGALAPNLLVSAAAPVASLGVGIGQFLFDTDDGRLFWDANGTTAGGAFHIATLNFGLGLIPALTNADFLVIA